MKLKAPESLNSTERIAFYDCEENIRYYQYGTAGGWKKYKGNPVFGGKYGTCFDVSLLAEEKENGEILFRMWFSWRPERSIGYTESPDGIHWKDPVVVLAPLAGSSWEADEVNRPVVIRKDERYLMWYSGQMRPYRENGRSVIALAESMDGICWKRREEPVLEPDQEWEQQAVMCPHVLFDEDDHLYKMWYAAGCNHEPDAIGYAQSRDGIHWEKYRENPVLGPAPENPWEQHKVVAPCVLKEDGWFYMFYVGHLHEERAQVGLARSRNGITGWQRHPGNPLIRPGKGSGDLYIPGEENARKDSWDSVAVYKPFVLKTGDRWMMWYNGAAYEKEIWVMEQIGLAILDRNSLF